MESLTLKYRLTEPEYLCACNSHASAHKQGARSNILIGLAMLIIGFALSVFFFWVAIFLSVVGAALMLITWLRSVLWRRAFREAKKYNDDICVAIGDTGLHVETAGGKSDLNWEFFTWYLETPEHILLYMTKRYFSVIPKKSFADTQSVNQFMKIVESKLKRIR